MISGNQEYGTVSGTGASAALGVGIVSLLQSAKGDLTPDDIAHILEKTAAPVGGPGYDNQSGYGLIDAGAAMDYVQTHDIKHGTTTDGQVEQIFSDRLMTFVSSTWEEVASGAYYVMNMKLPIPFLWFRHQVMTSGIMQKAPMDGLQPIPMIKTDMPR